MSCKDLVNNLRGKQCNGCQTGHYIGIHQCWIDYYNSELDFCTGRGTVKRLLQCLIDEPKSNDYLFWLYQAVKYYHPELLIEIDKFRVLK